MGLVKFDFPGREKCDLPRFRAGSSRFCGDAGLGSRTLDACANSLRKNLSLSGYDIIQQRRSSFASRGDCMPIIIDLTERELAELKELTKETDASAAIRFAMREYVRYARRMQLKAMSGQVEMNYEQL